jgi:hypothetical protein
MLLQFRTMLTLAVAAGLLLGGCGLVYQAGSQVKTRHMLESLKPGQTTLKIHQDWGEPDLRKDADQQTEIWSYARRPNSNDFAATVLYTSTKPGDEGKFLDLKFVNSKLVSWSEQTHTIPVKQGAGFNYGLGSGGNSSPISHY